MSTVIGQLTSASSLVTRLACSCLFGLAFRRKPEEDLSDTSSSSPLNSRSLFEISSKMPTKSLDGISFEWNQSKEDIEKAASELIEDSRRVYDLIGSLDRENATYANIVKVLADSQSAYDTKRNVLDFPQHVSPDKEVRAASTEADKKLSAFEVEMSMRKDVFDNLVACMEKGGSMPAEGKRFLERLIKYGKRNGLHLSPEIQDEIKMIKKRMSDLSIDFNKNINEENTILEFSEQELSGLPGDFVSSLDKGEGDKLKVTLKYPHYFPVMKKATNAETRKIMEAAFSSRCMEENTPILEELVELRAKMASLLGYKNHAAYVTEMRMAKTGEIVANFLAGLAKKLDPLGEKEIEQLLALKKAECEENSWNFDGKLNMWDLKYYMRIIEEKMYSVDHNKLKEYFPLSVVTKGLLEMYQELLCLRFSEIPKPNVWHDDVTMFSVNDPDTQELLGYFYLDLFPREGKFSHAACFGIQPGCLQPDHTRQYSVAAMVANFPKPSDERPSLLTHDEVETFFHEFGHVMHQICARADFALFSGTHVERDFVEAPSQMLENWCWEKEPLLRMSQHYKDGSAIPDEVLEKLLNSRLANAGLFNLRQITLGSFDQAIHTRDKADTKKIFAETAERIMKVSPSPGTSMAASFGHLAGGYDAQYYGYLWSEVYSMDMFHTRFKKEGIMNAKVGRDYREKILKPGGTIDALDMVKGFLGREPNQDAFLTSKGLKTSN